VVCGTEIGQPVPAEDALGTYDHIAPEGSHGVKERLTIARQVFVQYVGALRIQNAQVHAASVQIDAAVVLVLTTIETHEVPPGVSGFGFAPDILPARM
jgi:hypothetical protein